MPPCGLLSVQAKLHHFGESLSMQEIYVYDVYIIIFHRREGAGMPGGQ